MTGAGPYFQIHSRLENANLPFGKPIALTIGNFDGVHLGHQAILKRTKQRAKAIDALSVAVTFSPHPTKYFRPKNAKEELTTLAEKVRFILESGVDCVVVVEFNEWLSKLDASQFCEQVLERKFDLREIVVGYDFHFGKNRSGNFDFLKKYFEAKNVNVEQLNAVEISTGVVSSTSIRNLVKKGDVRQAAAYLGRPYSLIGRIVSGDAKAREMGFPTANLKWENELVPKIGIYACMVEFESDGLRGQLLPGVISCGHRPIMGEGLHLQIEAHIFDFSQNVYNMLSRFHFVEFLRDERPYSDWETLAAQIEVDCDQARKILLAEKFAGQTR